MIREAKGTIMIRALHGLAAVSLALVGCTASSAPSGASSEGGGDSGESVGTDDGSAADDSGGGNGDGSSGEVPAGCAVDPDLAPLFAPDLEVEPIVTVRDDGVIVTRAAGRVRGRHELENDYNPFVTQYFENRSYAFVIEDYVARGEDRIDISYFPAAPVSTYGSGTNLRAWKIYGDGNVFHNNTGFDTTIDLQHQVKTLTGNSREQRPMQIGDVMEFEFGVFIAGNAANDPGAIEGRTSYYTDTFRYRVGQGGLQVRNDDPSGRMGPGDDARLTGDASVPYVQSVDEQIWSFAQMAVTVQPEHIQPLLEGRRLFHTDFASGAHSEDGNPDLPEQAGKLGPQFNTTSCEGCHAHNGRSALPAEGEVLRTVAIKLYDDPAHGDQLQPQESEVTLERWELSQVALDDGTMVELRRPIYAGIDPSTAFSVRVARQLPGLGLLEAIDEADIVARAVADACQDDGGITGRANVVVDPSDGLARLGRFGWKAEKVSLRHQVADALLQDLGVTTTVFPEGGTPELDDADLDRLVTYSSLVGLPGRRDADDPQVMAGAALFGALGCDGCHVDQAFTASSHALVELRDQEIRPFSDLLLHDMGDGLADPQGGPLAREWRTAPLWGVGLLDEVHGEVALLHDGRARSFLEAVMWHDGEAAFARMAVMSLAASDREALFAFLDSL